MARRTRPVLTLVTERALREFIAPPRHSNVLEASGVAAKGGYYYVIFDNIRRIARVHRNLEPGSTKHAWFGKARQGDGYAGWPDEAPFDKIVVTAAPESIPQALVDQLKVGGIMAVPVGRGFQTMTIVRKTETGTVTKATIDVRFVPMIKKE